MLSIFRGTTIPALEQTAGFAERRHEMLAGNLANLDTPGYTGRDLSVKKFQEALADVLHPTKYASHAITPEETDFEGIGGNVEKLLHHDGTDLTLEHQVTQMAKNQHMHNLAVAVMRNQFQILTAAITERA